MSVFLAEDRIAGAAWRGVSAFRVCEARCRARCSAAVSDGQGASMELLAMLLCSALVTARAATTPEMTTIMAETTTLGDVPPQWSGWMYRAFAEGMFQFSITSPDPKCSRDGLLYRRHLQNLTLWATRSTYYYFYKFCSILQFLIRQIELSTEQALIGCEYLN